MATDLDAELNGVTCTVAGQSMSLTINSDTLRCIYLLALAALEKASGRALSPGRTIGFDVADSNGVRKRVEVTLPTA